MPPVAIHRFTFDLFAKEAASRLSHGAGAASRVYRQVMGEGRFDPEALGLGARASAAWRDAFSFALPEVVSVVEEHGEHGTTAKAVLRLEDDWAIECVRIPTGPSKETLCISSQVGCKMACRFCETAKMGLLRSLRADEIVAQLLVARHVLGWSFRNVVFMGMGEALDNVGEVVRALRVMNDPGGLRIGQERITVSTVGHLEGLRALAAEGFRRLNVTLSLTSADPATRAELVPLTRRFDLEALQHELAAFRPRTKFVLGVSYCLLPGINDAREDAARVAAFCAPIARVLVNVIPYNPGTAPLTRAPTDDEVDRFLGWLRDEGLPVRRRATRGRSVMAACGQLGDVGARNRRRALAVLP